MAPPDGRDDELRFLVCNVCRSCCLLAGPAGRAIAADPPACPGCDTRMRVAQRPPFRLAS